MHSLAPYQFYPLISILVVLAIVAFIRVYRRKSRERLTKPRIRHYHDPREKQRASSSGQFYVCPNCGYMADALCSCPECSLVNPAMMVLGDPDHLEDYIQRQRIFYGSPLDD